MLYPEIARGNRPSSALDAILDAYLFTPNMYLQKSYVYIFW